MDEIIFDADEDWEKRVLCSDEACIGVIGPDGKCKECGRAYDGIPPPANESEAEFGDIEKSHESDKEITDSDEDWEKRVLCSDEACIGVIGPDGKCKECGKPL